MSDGELRGVFKKHLRDFDILAVETGGTTSGVPDLHFCRQGISGWCEMKQCAHWRVTIRPMQIGWAERHLLHGGRVFCAVRRARDELWLFHGSMLRRLLTERLDAVESLGHWSGNPAKWDWITVARILTA